MGDWRCHCLLAASSLFPCLWQGAMLAGVQDVGCRSRRRPGLSPCEVWGGGVRGWWLSVRGGDAASGRQGGFGQECSLPYDEDVGRSAAHS